MVKWNLEKANEVVKPLIEKGQRQILGEHLQQRMKRKNARTERRRLQRNSKRKTKTNPHVQRSQHQSLLASISSYVNKNAGDLSTN